MTRAAQARRVEAERTGGGGGGAGGGGSGAATESDGLPEALSQNYSVKQKALLSRILPLPAEDPSPHTEARSGGGGQQFDRAGLEALLGQLSDFDEQMNLTAMERGAVAGMTPEQVREGRAGRRMRENLMGMERGAVAGMTSEQVGGGRGGRRMRENLMAMERGGIFWSRRISLRVCGGGH